MNINIASFCIVTDIVTVMLSHEEWIGIEHLEMSREVWQIIPTVNPYLSLPGAAALVGSRI